MSSLWTDKASDKSMNKNKPSPAKKMVLAQKPLSHPWRRFGLCIEKISLFISQGSMTVEAALIIPLFLFTFLHLTGVMEMLRLHGRLEAALWNVGNQAALYMEAFSAGEEGVTAGGGNTAWGKASSWEEDTAWEELTAAGGTWSGAALSLLVHSQLKSRLGETYLDTSPLVYGADGLNYLRSEYPDEEECVDILITYQVKPRFTIFPFTYRRMSSRYYARTWTGFDVTEAVKYVYVTSQGEVWHSTPQCSYIYHQIIAVQAAQISHRLNESGKQYTLCEFCRDDQAGADVYVTAEGEKYHTRRDCTAIHKDIIAVVWSEDLPYRACSRCASGGG